MQVEVQTPLGGTSLLSCTVSSRTDGRWSCPWDVTASNGGVAPSDKAQLTLRVQASDPFGHSAWSAAQTLIVDAQPPTVTVNLDGIKVYPGNVVHKQGGLTGQADDEHGVAGVEVCGDGECRAAILRPSGSGAARWSILRQSNELDDHVAHTIAIYAVDTLGNRTLQPLSFSVYLDDVAPAITVTQVITQVLLGSKQTVLSGTVSDGGTVTGMWVRAVAPDGQQSRSAVARDGDGWSFDLPADLPGQYVLLVQAIDGAENSSTSGPYTVDVTCTDAGPTGNVAAGRAGRLLALLADAERHDRQPRPRDAAGRHARGHLRRPANALAGNDKRAPGPRRTAGHQRAVAGGQPRRLRHQRRAQQPGGRTRRCAGPDAVPGACQPAAGGRRARSAAGRRLEPGRPAGRPAQQPCAGGAAPDQRRLPPDPGL